MSYTATHHLQSKIEQLESQRKHLEVVILSDVKVISDTIRHPAPYIRSTVSELASDRSFFSDLLSILLQYATSYVAGKFGRSMAKSGFISELFGGTDDQQGDNGSAILNLLKKVFKSKNQAGEDEHRDDK